MLTHMRTSKSPQLTHFISNNILTLSFPCFRIGVDFMEEEVQSKIGYLANIKPTTFEDTNNNESMALIFFFIQEDGSWFKAIKTYDPYFYVQCDEEYIK